ncbi:MAG: MutS family DNA mismatch repair protein [Planctomycetota bacterium]
MEPPARELSVAETQYRQRLKSIDEATAEARRVDRQYGSVRVVLFLVALSLFLLFSFSEAYGGTYLVLAAIAAFAFLVVATLNEGVRDRLAQYQQQSLILSRLIARVERGWERLEPYQLSPAQIDDLELTQVQRDVADDLDYFGRTSLFQFVSMAATQPGIRHLGRALCGPAIPEVADERADAVAALADLEEERFEFYRLAREVARGSGSPDVFVKWAASQPWLRRHAWLVAWANLSVLIAVVLLALLLGSFFGGLPPQWLQFAAAGLVLLAFGNAALTSFILHHAHEAFDVAMASRHAVDDYRHLFESAAWLPAGQGTRLDWIRNQLIGEITADAGSPPGTGPKAGAAGAMRELARVARAGALRKSAGTFLLYLPMQFFALWDVRVLRRLETWQSRHGGQVPDWFEALGELEALVSIAALRYENQDWVRATWVDAGTAELSATSIGHPLISDHDRVCNDVTLGPPGTLLLITGSNMSGKSTMLRSIGLNIALAAVGAPVCATQFQLPPLEMATSIRVSDSLGDGLSFYMAELQRLKRVVDDAARLSVSEDRVLLFLLDEILQGTNSRERQIAVVHVLSHLSKSQTIGAITTHDLELADEPALASVAQTVHFRESIHADADGNQRMTFDYRLRSGVSPTTNALELLKMVGLGDPDQN